MTESVSKFIPCAACSGSGWWYAAAVEGRAVKGKRTIHYERQRLPCVVCGGDTFVWLDIEGTDDRIVRMKKLSADRWGTP